MIAACLLRNLPGRSLVDRSVPAPYAPNATAAPNKHQTAASHTNSPNATPMCTHLQYKLTQTPPSPNASTRRTQSTPTTRTQRASGGAELLQHGRGRERRRSSHAQAQQRLDSNMAAAYHWGSFSTEAGSNGGREGGGSNGGLGDTGGGGPSRAAADRGGDDGAISAADSRLLACRALP